MAHDGTFEGILSLLERRSIVPTTGPPPEVQDIDADFSNFKLTKETHFSGFNLNHVKEANKLTRMLVDAKSLKEFQQIMEKASYYVSDGLYMFSVYSALSLRKDTKNLPVPPPYEVAPHWFFSAEAIHHVVQLSIKSPDKDICVTNVSTMSAADPESKLTYFREDIGVNSHHWIWHVIYPVRRADPTAPFKDRQGELFYYMHQQMLARYDSERLAHGMNRVRAFHNFHEPLEGYFSHLTTQNLTRQFPLRPQDMALQDMKDGVEVSDLYLWKHRILDAIDANIVYDTEGKTILLVNPKDKEDNEGINRLGFIVEANERSANPDFYGNLHNMGHNLVAIAQDPEERFEGIDNVMGFTESAVRDPVFFRWHRCIDNIFTRHKKKLPPYTKEELSFEGIHINNIVVKCKEHEDILETFMKYDYVDLSHAPFVYKGSGNRKIQIKYKHLDHEPFTYEIELENKTDEMKEVTLRIFLAPKYDEYGELFMKKPNLLRRLMIELDKFHEQLEPGRSTIHRRSNESSVTINTVTTFADIMAKNYEVDTHYCNCGWPQNLLIPRGHHHGMEFILFVMATDYSKDKVEQPNPPLDCKQALSYCGSMDQKYPDKKPMGFPFDRRLIVHEDKDSWEEFRTGNKIMKDIKIKFTKRPISPSSPECVNVPPAV